MNIFDIEDIVLDGLFGSIEKEEYSNGEYVVSGWAVCGDKKTHKHLPPLHLCAVVGGVIVVRCAPGIIRRDIKDYFSLGEENAMFGFSLAVPVKSNASLDSVFIYATRDDAEFFPITWQSLLHGRDFLSVKYLYMQQLMERHLHREPPLAISPAESMANAYYYEVGKAGARVVIQACMASDSFDFTNILDIPCGHGRIARYLRVLFPYSFLDCCDIDRKGVDFCASEFQANGIYSDEDIRRVSFSKQYNLIWIGSLFTHLPEQAIYTWIERMIGLLRPSGIVMATLHGRGIMQYPPGNYCLSEQAYKDLFQDCDISGWAFQNYAKASVPQIDMDSEYGVSLCRPSHFLAMLERFPEVKIYSYRETGWAAHQDVVVFGRF